MSFLLFFSKITFYWKLFSDCCDQYGYPGSIVYLSYSCQVEACLDYLNPTVAIGSLCAPRINSCLMTNCTAEFMCYADYFSTRLCCQINLKCLRREVCNTSTQSWDIKAHLVECSCLWLYTDDELDGLLTLLKIELEMQVRYSDSTPQQDLIIIIVV